MHASYMNTRSPNEFDRIKWTGDRFHVKAHTCRYVASSMHKRILSLSSWNYFPQLLSKTPIEFIPGLDVAHRDFNARVRAIYDPDEYSTYDHTNTSMIEQWHSIMDTLSTTVKGSSLAHAMFLLQTLQDDHYRAMCVKNQYPGSSQTW
jgi:hypothetical protein